MTTSSSEKVPANPTNAATRTALALTRLLTNSDPRVPALLPAEEAQMTATISNLEAVAADHADRCYQHNPRVPARERAFAAMVYTRSALELVKATNSWAMTSSGDHAPLHAAAEAALLATLTWQLINGKSIEYLRVAAQSCALGVAADMAREGGPWLDSTALAARFRDAAEVAATPDVDPDTRIDFEAEPELWRARADTANRAVRFMPIDTDATDGDQEPTQRPCVEVAGIQTYTYMNERTGKLTVSLHFDDAAPWLLDEDGNVPVEINVGDSTVFEV